MHKVLTKCSLTSEETREKLDWRMSRVDGKFVFVRNRVQLGEEG